MKMPTIVVLASVFSLALSGFALAGSHVYKHPNGKKIRLNCTGGGCISIHYNKKGQKTKKVKGPGGRSNFYKTESKIKALGYK